MTQALGELRLKWTRPRAQLIQFQWRCLLSSNCKPSGRSSHLSSDHGLVRRDSSFSLLWSPPPILWHERLILATCACGRGWHIILTPDGDMYPELISLENDDITGFRVSHNGELPHGLTDAISYRIRQLPDAAAMQQLRLDARHAAAALAFPPGAGPQVAAPPVAAPAAVAGDAAPGNVTWVVIETEGNRQRGETVGLDGSEIIQGNIGLKNFMGHGLPLDAFRLMRWRSILGKRLRQTRVCWAWNFRAFLVMRGFGEMWQKIQSRRTFLTGQFQDQGRLAGVWNISTEKVVGLQITTSGGFQRMGCKQIHGEWRSMRTSWRCGSLRAVWRVGSCEPGWRWAPFQTPSADWIFLVREGPLEVAKLVERGARIKSQTICRIVQKLLYSVELIANTAMWWSLRIFWNTYPKRLKRMLPLWNKSARPVRSGPLRQNEQREASWWVQWTLTTSAPLGASYARTGSSARCFPFARSEEWVRWCTESFKGLFPTCEAEDRVDDWVNDIVSSLNSMYLGEELMADFDPACKPNLAQRRCLDRIRESVWNLGSRQVIFPVREPCRSSGPQWAILENQLALPISVLTLCHCPPQLDPLLLWNPFWAVRVLRF